MLGEAPGKERKKMMVAGADGDFCGASSLVPVEVGVEWQRPALVYSGIRWRFVVPDEIFRCILSIES